jgi:hypothetical protein
MVQRHVDRVFAGIQAESAAGDDLMSSSSRVTKCTCALALLPIAIAAMTMFAKGGSGAAQRNASVPNSSTKAQDSLPDIPLVNNIQAMAENSRMPQEVRDRAREALRRLENGVLDPRPILVFAQLMGHAREPDALMLHLVLVDKDLDLRGLRVREQRKTPNGVWATIVEESYPLYAGDEIAPPMPLAVDEGVTVCLRQRGEVKDERAWQSYTIQAMDDLLRKLIIPTIIGISDGQLVLRQTKANADDKGAKSVRPSTERVVAMPPIWISVSKPNELRVLVSVYDRAGNVSEDVEVDTFVER